MIATHLRVPGRPGRDAHDVVLEHLGDRDLLLLLDNCEHLVGAVAEFVDTVIRDCHGVKVLTTTREPLGLPGEHVHTVAPLPADIGSAAVELFVERATAAGAAPPTEADLPTIATICQRLDGLPLAIELAATRSRILSVEGIASRLDERFSLLTGGSRTALPRQRTLEATVAWSYDLLPRLAQHLLRRLAVFAASFSLEDVETVGASDPINPTHVLELVAELSDRSLLTVEAGAEPQYRMLETIRAYARERLVGSGDEVDTVRRRHLRWTSEQAALAAANLEGPEQMAWLGRVERRLDDHRAAMAWSLANGHHALGAAVAASLYRYWYLRNVREGRRWLDRFVEHVDDYTVELAARVLFTHGSLLRSMGDYGPSMVSLRRSVAIYETVDNPRGLGYALHYLMRSSWGLRPRGEVRALTERGLDIFRRAADLVGIGLSLLFLAIDEYEQDRFDEGLEFMRECDAVMRAVGAPHLVAHGPEITAWGLQAKGELAAAARGFQEALELYQRVGNPLCTAHCLENVALLLSGIDPLEAATLLGATASLRNDIGVPVPPYEDLSAARAMATINERSEAEAWRAAWGRGAELTAPQALDRALSAVTAIG